MDTGPARASAPEPTAVVTIERQDLNSYTSELHPRRIDADHAARTARESHPVLGSGLGQPS
jgi:hypothetical protein